MKHFFGLMLFVCLMAGARAQQIEWTNIEHLPQNGGQKIYMVDFYTTWCGYCKKMDRETFTDPTVAKLLSTYFISVKFNAEGNSSFTWKGVKYSATPTAPGARPGVHMFAKSVLGQRIGFPSFGFFGADQSLLTIVQGYQTVNEMVTVLWYFASGDYRKESFDHFSKVFEKEKRPAMNKALNIK